MRSRNPIHCRGSWLARRSAAAPFGLPSFTPRLLATASASFVLMRELMAGSTRFNDLRRGVPNMSPTLLSQRLKDLEQSGIVERRPLQSERGVLNTA